MSTPLEICAYSLESCVAAQKAGASRVELCASPQEGGTTPSYGTILQARKILKNPKLFAIIRPRGGDFLYSQDEFEQMIKDAEAAVLAGVDGIVLGILNKDGSIDVDRTRQIIEHARAVYLSMTNHNGFLGVTFHRAFDRSDVFSVVNSITHPYNSIGKDRIIINKAKLEERINEVIATGAERILTSGFMHTAEEGACNLKLIIEIRNKINKERGTSISIMAGSGIDSSNIQMILKCGVDELHTSAKSIKKGAMQYCSPFFDSPDETEILYSDIRKISDIQNEIH